VCACVRRHRNELTGFRQSHLVTEQLVHHTAVLSTMRFGRVFRVSIRWDFEAGMADEKPPRVSGDDLIAIEEPTDSSVRGGAFTFHINSRPSFDNISTTSHTEYGNFYNRHDVRIMSAQNHNTTFLSQKQSVLLGVWRIMAIIKITASEAQTKSRSTELVKTLRLTETIKLKFLQVCRLIRYNH